MECLWSTHIAFGFHFDFCVKLTSDPSTRKTSLTYGHYSAAAVAGALVSGLVGC